MYTPPPPNYNKILADPEEGLNNKSSVNYMYIAVHMYMYVHYMCIVNLLHKRIYVNNKS